MTHTFLGDAAFGEGFTGHGVGYVGSFAIVSNVDENGRFFEGRWLAYHDHYAERVPASDGFQSLSFLYGLAVRQTALFGSAAAGVGLSSGEVRGGRLWKYDGTTWYRPTRFESVALEGEATAGIAGPVGGIGVRTIAEVDPVRQTIGAELVLFFGRVTNRPWRVAP